VPARVSAKRPGRWVRSSEGEMKCAGSVRTGLSRSARRGELRKPSRARPVTVKAEEGAEKTNDPLRTTHGNTR
jgi:hypothetical protein